MDKNKVTFEKKWLDRAIPPRFDINYWILKKIGLEGFRVLCVLGGALFTVIIYEVVIPYFN